jgi:signal transduction histidine kinase
MTLDDSQIAWLGWISIDADGSVQCSDAALCAVLGLPRPRATIDELDTAFRRLGAEHGLQQLRRQGQVTLVTRGVEGPGPPGRGQELLIREIASAGPASSFLAGRPKAGSLRELRLVLLGEALARPEQGDTAERLAQRIGRVFRSRGHRLLLLRHEDGGASMRPLIDSGVLELLPAEESDAPERCPGSGSVYAHVLREQEPMYLKPSELTRLFSTLPDAVEGGGALRGEALPRGAGAESALIVPVAADVVLALVGLDLGPEDLATAQELGQLVLLLYQERARQQQDASLVGELRDSVQQLSQQQSESDAVLGNLLRASRDLRGAVDLQSTLRRIAELIRENLGYEIVAISAIEGKLVHNKVLLGVDESIRERYGGVTSRLSELEPFFDPRFALSSSYFIPHDADVYTEENRYFLYRPDLEERPEGMWQPGDNFITPLRNNEGRLIGMISLDAPRTGRRPDLAKTQLLELYANHAALAIENAGQVSELTKLNQELRDLDRIRNEFIANVSHELRTPVASILGYAHLLMEHGSENLTERQRHFLSVLAKNTERLSCLVDNLVDVSELNAEDPTLRLEPLDLRDIYQEVLARLEAQIRVHRLELRQEVPREPLLVLGDRHRLRQVLFAVLSNAILFNREHGLLEITLERPSPGTVSFRVSDSGSGLSKDKLHEILDRFYQVDHAQVPLEINSNLGLSLAYKHVRAHRGNLVLQSEEGAGTRVTVTIPAFHSF